MRRGGPLKRTAMRVRRRNTGPSKATTDQLVERAGGVCEFCGSCRHLERQHRRARGAGGTLDDGANELPNLLLLCHEHHAWAETRDPEAARLGLWVTQWNSAPALVPFHHWQHGWVLLTDTGYQPATEGS